MSFLRSSVNIIRQIYNNIFSPGKALYLNRLLTVVCRETHLPLYVMRVMELNNMHFDKMVLHPYAVGNIIYRI